MLGLLCFIWWIYTCIQHMNIIISYNQTSCQKYIPNYWHFVLGNHRFTMDSYHKGPVMRIRGVTLRATHVGTHFCIGCSADLSIQLCSFTVPYFSRGKRMNKNQTGNDRKWLWNRVKLTPLSTHFDQTYVPYDEVLHKCCGRNRIIYMTHALTIMYIYTYIYIYTCMYVCVYVCVYVCMHACMHTLLFETFS